MMFIKNVFKLSFLVFILSYFISCSQSYNNESNNNSNVLGGDGDSETLVAGGIPEIESLFKEEDNICTLSVNDERFWSSQGYTLWKLLPDVPSVVENDFSVEVVKSSGVPEAGYGVVFGSYESYHGNSMFVLLLNTNMQFSIGELQGTSFKSICPWTYKDFITSGYDSINKVKVSYNKYRYEIYINENFAFAFTVPHSSLHLSGKNGYIVVISPKDRLPDETVCVKFNLL